METKNAVSKRWDDLVFENRNKEYGAYSIRKAYSENVNKGFMMSLGTALLFFIIPFIASSFKTIEPRVPICTLPGTIIDTKPPIIEPIKPKQKIAPPPVKKVDGNQFVVTDKPVDDAEIEKIDIHNPPSDGDTDATGDNLTFTDGPGTDLVEGPPAVVEPPKPIIYTGITATYKGGMEAMGKFLRKHLKYPSVARRMGDEGTVYVSFVVNTDGKVINATVIKGISKECDEEAVRVVSLMSDWIPAQQNNLNVMVRMVLPISFHIDKDVAF